MINREPEVFTAISAALRLAYSGIYVVGTELTKAPSRFPACTIRQIGNYVNDKYSTLGEIENAAREDYEVNVYSNLTDGAEAQTRNIMSTVSDEMKKLYYKRIFDEPMSDNNAKSRRVARFQKTDVI